MTMRRQFDGCEAVFPPTPPGRYHYDYVANALAAAGVAVHRGDVGRRHKPCMVPSNRPPVDGLSLEFMLDGKRILADYADAPDIRFDVPHLRFGGRVCDDLVKPVTGTSFLDWRRAEALWGEIEYTAKGARVLANWRMEIRHDRPRVAAMLAAQFGARVDVERTAQEDWWAKFANCLCYVQVPGYNNHKLDRGHAQAMAFGVCVVAPEIKDRMAFNKVLVPGVHYVQCRADYSDVCAMVEWCAANREACVEIGRKARELFMSTSTPLRLAQWIDGSGVADAT